MKAWMVMAALVIACAQVSAYVEQNWGGAGFESTPGDFDGDGRTDYGVYHRAEGAWYVLSTRTNILAWGFPWGGPGARPVVADYDGDGADDFGVYYPDMGGTWYAYSPARTSVVTWAMAWGWTGTAPVAGDYDGDAISDLAVYDEATGRWFVLPSAGQATASAGDTNAFRAALEQAGFEVRPGVATNVDIVALFNAGILPSCYGNNAATPYSAFALPRLPGQTTTNIMPWSYRLRADEAVVMVARTPPEAIYYSYRSYLTIRYFPQTGLRSRVFGSMGDAINNFTIRSSGTPNGNPGNAFEKDMVIIFTADRGVDARIRAAAHSAGFTDSLINTDVMPASLAHFGLDQNADEFAMLHRVSYFADTNAGAAYVNGLPNQATVWRVTPVTPPEPDPFPTPALRVRGTGTTEYDLNPTLEALRDAILSAHAAYDATQLVTSVWITDGFDGIQRGADVLADCRDTVYLRTDDFSMTNGDFVVVYGVNHAASGKATYANVNVYGVTPTVGNDNEMAGVGSIGTPDGLAGTARTYLGDHPQADLFYAYRIAWDNPSGVTNCLIIPPPTGRLQLRVLRLGFRAYIEPGRAVGPATGEILYDRAILFRARP
jgi:hypothetical protein